MAEKAPKKRIFKKGKIPLGKKSRKTREKKVVFVASEIKEQGRHAKLPNINRVIAEWKKKAINASWAQAVWLSIIILGLGMLVWQMFVFAWVYPSFSKLLSERNTLEAELHTWENIATKYPSYRDAHVQAEIVAYRLGKKDIQELELRKILEIDPNFELKKF